MNKTVRISVDGEKEILSDLLNRMMEESEKEEITWMDVLGYFSKRGKLQGYKEI